MDIFVHALIETIVRSEAELISGELIIEGRLIDASNATLYGVIRNSIEDQFAVVYKPIAGERPLWDFPDGNLASREVAAFLVSKEVGFNCVPTTVLRDGPFGIGAVQEWIDIKDDTDVIAIAQSKARAIRNMALFDVVINNTDRKFGHILPVDDTTILGCDHGVAFHEEFKLRTVIWQFAGEERISTDGWRMLEEIFSSASLQMLRSLQCVNELFNFYRQDFPILRKIGRQFHGLRFNY
jgi:uncharacterized repeat protein (TIGR03843 family)